MQTSPRPTRRAPSLITDNFGPVGREIEATGLVVHGTLPPRLNGTLFRNGPNPQFPDPGAHWFVGDGMLHAISLRDGEASYRNRWVRTPKWSAEQHAGRPLFSGFGTKIAPELADDSGTANTNVVWHGGQLLALEEAHLPTRVDPASLDTVGYQDFGQLRGPFTSHPKVDPASGEMIFFGYNAAGAFTSTISLSVVDKHGALLRHDTFDAPYASMIHDFVVTENYVLVPVLPLVGSMERAMGGQSPYAWEPHRSAYLGVIPRKGPISAIRWFSGPACYAFHFMNAWEENGAIVAEVMAMNAPPLFPRMDGTRTDPTATLAHLSRWTIDLSDPHDAFQSLVIDDLPGEFPRIDDRYAGTPHRHGWIACNRAATGTATLGGLAHFDRETGLRQTYWLDDGDAVSEPVFAPRGASEGDGFLLAVMWRAAQARSELLIFEALDLEAGPVARVEMTQRIPFGFHGNWVAQDQLEGFRA